MEWVSLTDSKPFQGRSALKADKGYKAEGRGICQILDRFEISKLVQREPMFICFVKADCLWLRGVTEVAGLRGQVHAIKPGWAERDIAISCCR